MEKFAYLAPDGKLHLQKPSVRTVSAYRERHWVDYNNPRWIENQDRYSVKSVARLNLDTAAYILAELDMQAPEMMKSCTIFINKRVTVGIGGTMIQVKPARNLT